MRKVTYKEFQARLEEVEKARRIFIDSGITSNITTAFAIYQEVLAEERMAVMVSTEEYGQRPMNIMDLYIRPRCKKCKAEMRLRVL